MLLHTFTNILVKKFLGNNLVPRFLCFAHYKRITHFVLFFTQAFRQGVHSVLFFSLLHASTGWPFKKNKIIYLEKIVK